MPTKTQLPASLPAATIARGSVNFFVLLFALTVSGLLGSTGLWGWASTIRVFQVGAMQPVFADLRTISGALESQAQGLDPHLRNPGDPWGRPFNYPELWLDLFRGLSHVGDSVLIVGGTQAALLVALGLWLSRRRCGYLATVFLLSPPMLLLIDRGSTDMLIFLLTLAGLRYATLPGGLALGLAVSLKLFPAAAIPGVVLWPPRRRFLAGLVLMAPLMVWTFLQVREIVEATPAGASSAFGALSLGILVVFHVTRMWPGPSGLLASLPPLTPTLDACLLAAAVALWLARRRYYAQLQRDVAARDVVFQRLLIGSGCLFVAIFASGSHFAYRIIFLLPVVWQFAELHRPGLVAGCIAVLYTPLLPHGWIIFNPAVALYTLALTPLLMEFAAAWMRRSTSTTMS